MKTICAVLLAVIFSFELQAQSEIHSGKKLNRNCLTLGVGDAKFIENGSDNFLFTAGFFINHFDNFYIKYGADVFKLSYYENELHYSLSVIPNLNFNFAKKKVDLFGG